MEYNEEDYLQLSGIQHYAFCRRQWALIHIEGLWQENEKTVDGEFFHKNAHDGLLREKRGDILIVRGMSIHSVHHGLSGQCDVIEFHKSDHGVSLNRESGLWIPYPVEYKRGTKKADICDEAQLCAQAMCLEEMYCCQVNDGALFYGENCRRQEVIFTEELRSDVKKMIEEMHNLFQRGYTPNVRYSKRCDNCSLKEICMPKLMESGSVKTYMQRIIGEL